MLDNEFNSYDTLELLVIFSFVTILFYSLEQREREGESDLINNAFLYNYIKIYIYINLFIHI